MFYYSHVFPLFVYFVFHIWLSRLEGTEEKLRNRESRPEDLRVIAELREMVTEREVLVKKLVVSGAMDGGLKRLKFGQIFLSCLRRILPLLH